MRKNQKEALSQVVVRAGINHQQLDDLCKIVASTYGPLVIGSLIERGLETFRTQKSSKTEKKMRRKSA